MNNISSYPLSYPFNLLMLMLTSIQDAWQGTPNAHAPQNAVRERENTNPRGT